MCRVKKINVRFEKDNAPDSVQPFNKNLIRSGN